MTSRGTHSPVYTGVRGETSSPIEDFPSPPPLVGNGTREFDIRGRTSEGSRVSGSGEGIIDDVMRRKADAGAAGGNTVLGRVETSRLRVHTGAPGLNVSDWSLQSCDDADDGAVSKTTHEFSLLMVIPAQKIKTMQFWVHLVSINVVRSLTTNTTPSFHIEW